MENKFKHLLALVMALIMVVSCMTTTVFATDTGANLWDGTEATSTPPMEASGNVWDGTDSASTDNLWDGTDIWGGTTATFSSENTALYAAGINEDVLWDYFDYANASVVENTDVKYVESLTVNNDGSDNWNTFSSALTTEGAKLVVTVERSWLDFRLYYSGTSSSIKLSENGYVNNSSLTKPEYVTGNYSTFTVDLDKVFEYLNNPENVTLPEDFDPATDLSLKISGGDVKVYECYIVVPSKIKTLDINATTMPSNEYINIPLTESYEEGTTLTVHITGTTDTDFRVWHGTNNGGCRSDIAFMYMDDNGGENFEFICEITTKSDETYASEVITLKTIASWDTGNQTENSKNVITGVTVTSAKVFKGTKEEYLEILPRASVNGTNYNSVAKAIAAAKSGETVTLVDNCTESTVMVPSDVTLDLNGYNLTVSNYLVSFGDIVDTSDKKDGVAGKLIVAKNKNMISKSNAQLPVWVEDGYVFTANTLQFNSNGVIEYTEDGKAILRFFAYIERNARPYLADNGSSDNGVSVVVRVSWAGTDGTNYRDFIYNDALVQDATANEKAYAFSVTGYEAYTDLTFTVLLMSDTGVAATSEAFAVSNVQ